MKKLFAIGDLHLSGAVDKPMDVFGIAWEQHFQRICEAWYGAVQQEDIVLIPGDISWAMTLEQAKVDLDSIAALPGRKVLIRGNHDYWWNSISRVRNALLPGLFAIQNDSIQFKQCLIAGTRGWTCPGSQGFTSDDQKIYQREVARLELSLNTLPNAQVPRIVMMHFPPFNEKQQDSDFTKLLERHRVNYVVYGHLHAKSCKAAFEGERNGIVFHLVSADHVGFAPKPLLTL